MPRRLFRHSLLRKLNCPLKKKKEQHLILSRLTIIDQQFYLERIRDLYQTYFDLGLQHQVWLVSFRIITSLLMSLISLYFKDDILQIIQSNETNII